MKFLLILIISLSSAWAHADLILYTDRPTDRMMVATEAFKKQTGINTQIVELGWNDLKAKLASEGSNSPADVIMVKDVVFLNELVKESRLASMDSKIANEKVDPSMRTEFWTAITYRARTLIYDPQADVSQINSYADLADPKYAGTLCLRTSKSAYNEALVAGMINSYGYDSTSEILNGWLNNLVDFSQIYPNDNSIITDVAEKKCRFGMINSYYLGLALLKDPTLQVSLKFLDMKNGGSHTNGIGAGISVTSKDQALAQQFIDFMLGEEMQKYFSEVHQDFPANREVTFPTATKIWSVFELDQNNWSMMTDTVDQARQLFEELDYQ